MRAATQLWVAAACLRVHAATAAPSCSFQPVDVTSGCQNCALPAGGAGFQFGGEIEELGTGGGAFTISAMTSDGVHLTGTSAFASDGSADAPFGDDGAVVKIVPTERASQFMLHASSSGSGSYANVSYTMLVRSTSAVHSSVITVPMCRSRTALICR